MKKHLILLMASLAAFCSCDKFLSNYPSNEITAGNFYQTESDFNQAVIGCYVKLKTNMSFFLTELAFRSDEASLVDMTTSTQDRYNLDHFQEQSTTNLLASQWNAWYNGIYRCNDVLDNIEDKDFPNKAQYKAEALFIRSWFYFNLYRIFGVVPLAERVLTPAESKLVPRCTKDQMYELLVRDLTWAADNLPVERGVESARVTRIAAWTLLGKVQLTFGKYADAKTSLANGMEDPNFGLMGTTGAAFDVNNKMNKEIIFALYYNKSNDNGHGYWWSSSTNVEEDIRNPSEELKALYSSQDNRGPLIKHSIQKTETIYVMPKWNDDYDGTYTTQVGNDFPFLRYADLVLMRAEAIGLAGDIPSSLPYINQIRTRAGIAPLTAAQINSKEAFLKALADERGREFALEGQRWFDLVRLGQAVDYFIELGYNMDSHNLIFPIPDEQMKIVNNTAILWQNPGY